MPRSATDDERDLVYPPVIATAKAVFRGLGLKFAITGTEHIPREGGAVLAINHTGWLDFTFAGLPARSAGRLVRFMAKESIFDNPVAGPLMRGMKHIPVDREAGAASYRAAVTYLRRGEIVGVFPEATMSRSFELLPFKSGAVRMAVAGKAPILPMVIWGSQRVWTNGHRRPVSPRRILVTIDVLPPVGVSRGEDPEEATEKLRAVMEGALHLAQERYPDAPTGPEDSWWLPARLGGSAPTPEQAEQIAQAKAAERAARREAREAAPRGSRRLRPKARRSD